MRCTFLALMVLSCDSRSVADGATVDDGPEVTTLDGADGACIVSPACAEAFARFCECCPDPGNRCTEVCFVRILNGWAAGACEAYATQTCGELEAAGHCGGANGPLP